MFSTLENVCAYMQVSTLMSLPFGVWVRRSLCVLWMSMCTGLNIAQSTGGEQGVCFWPWVPREAGVVAAQALQVHGHSP